MQLGHACSAEQVKCSLGIRIVEIRIQKSDFCDNLPVCECPEAAAPSSAIVAVHAPTAAVDHQLVYATGRLRLLLPSVQQLLQLQHPSLPASRPSEPSAEPPAYLPGLAPMPVQRSGTASGSAAAEVALPLLQHPGQQMQQMPLQWLLRFWLLPTLPATPEAGVDQLELWTGYLTAATVRPAAVAASSAAVHLAPATGAAACHIAGSSPLLAAAVASQDWKAPNQAAAHHSPSPDKLLWLACQPQAAEVVAAALPEMVVVKDPGHQQGCHCSPARHEAAGAAAHEPVQRCWQQHKPVAGPACILALPVARFCFVAAHVPAQAPASASQSAIPSTAAAHLKAALPFQRSPRTPSGLLKCAAPSAPELAQLRLQLWTTPLEPPAAELLWMLQQPQLLSVGTVSGLLLPELLKAETWIFKMGAGQMTCFNSTTATL